MSPKGSPAPGSPPNTCGRPSRSASTSSAAYARRTRAIAYVAPTAATSPSAYSTRGDTARSPTSVTMPASTVPTWVGPP